MSETPATPAAHTPDDHDAHHVARHVKMYLTVGAILFVFTVITVALSYFDFGSHGNNIVVGMLVAAFKAGCVAAVFMHLAHEKRLIYRVLIFTVIFTIGLFALTIFGWADPIPGTEHTLRRT
jgi:caa(3)-type oxidase subunit IV